MRKPTPVSSRFWKHVKKSQDKEGCWVWVGSFGGGPYGQITEAVAPYKRKMHRPSRVSWEMHFGPIPAGMWVLHHCDNPPCVRPDHLFIGNRSDNIRDAIAKGRIPPPAGQSKKPHCLNRHEYVPGSFSINNRGHRVCLLCTRIRDRLRRPV
jgi:hypothetical protein